MSDAESEKSGYGLVYENSTSIASLLRSAANPHRIRILALAMRGKNDFSEMMEGTALSKTALANHLGQLVENGLMIRQSRGKYGLTSDGKELLSSAFSTYRRSARRVEDEKNAIRMSYGLAYGQSNLAGSRLISGEASYQPCWLSLLGAVSGSLTALGTKTSVTEVGGFTGYSFLINVAKGETCPSGPTALHIETFQEMLRGIECLGWRVHSREYPHSYPSRPDTPSVEDLKVARGVFERVRREIDRRDRPVVLYGLAAPEYGIVRGYDGESYIASTFRSLLNSDAAEDPIPYHRLNAPGCIDEVYFVKKVKVRRSAARKDALARAFRFASGNVKTQKNYLSGPLALAEWARVLEEVPQDSQNYMGNSYVGACVQEGREISSAFLKSIAKHAPSSQSMRLSKASTSYSRGAESMAQFTKMFPFGFEGRMPATKRRRGARLLREVQELEEKAAGHLGKVV